MRHRKIVTISLFISIMLLLINTSFAATYDFTYELLDKPDGSKNYHLTVSFSETLYENYRNRSHTLPYYNFSKFVTPNALKPIADDLWSIYSNEEDFVNGVLMIVHQISYVRSDPQKYPIETIFENEGDCDPLSILAASIMKAGGLDVILLLFEQQNHMLLGVHLPESPKDARSTPYFYRYEGKKYYIAEATGGNWKTGWRVGETPKILQKALAKVIPVMNYEKEAPGKVSSSYTIPDSSELRMSLSANFVVTQNDIEITGELLPSLAGEKVTLYANSFGSPSTLLATVEIEEDGNYSYIWASPPSGIYSIRATWSGDEDYNSAISSAFPLIVIPYELLIMGITFIFLLVMLFVVNRVTRGMLSEEPETFEELEEDF